MMLCRWLHGAVLWNDVVSGRVMCSSCCGVEDHDIVGGSGGVFRSLRCWYIDRAFL